MLDAAVLNSALHVQGWMGKDGLEWLAERAAGKSLVVEVGVWRGRTTTVLSAVAKRVLAVDTWGGAPGIEATSVIVDRIGADGLFSEYCLRFAEKIRDGVVTPIRIDSSKAAQIMDVYMRGEKADMLFIDGDHDRLYADLEVFSPMVKDGGLLCGHDYSRKFPAVMRDVEKHVPGFRNGPNAIWWKVV